MQDKWAIGGVSRDEQALPAPPAGTRMPFSARLLVFVVGLVAVAAIGAAAWVYTETQRDLRRVAADIAQIKLSLELYGRQQTAGGEAEAPAPADSGALRALENRLAILEENWRARGATVPATTPPPAATESTSAGPLDDCMPQGTRFLVTAGDSYPVCGTSGVVDVIGVGELEVTLAGGEPIVVGGSATLAGTSCIVAVLSANADGLSGYGELRVSC